MRISLSAATVVETAVTLAAAALFGVAAFAMIEEMVAPIPVAATVATCIATPRSAG